MTDTVEAASHWRKFRFTPLRDLLRGHVTGKLDWRETIHHSSLAPSIQPLIVQVVRRTRLWRSEKVAVASELIAHFQDGLESGASAKDLVQSFGDAKRTARLIRRAKLRTRPIPWRVLRGVKWTVGTFIALYAMLAIRFFIGTPHPTTDYLAQFNAVTLRTPASDRAWPIYRQAILQLSHRTGGQRWPDLLDYNPEGKHWPEVAGWLSAHQQAIATARRASDKSVFGFILGAGGSQHDPEMGWDFTSDRDSGSPARDALAITRLPYLSEVRPLAQVICRDVKLASGQHDADRALADINTALALADQIRDDKSFLVCDLVSIGIRALTIDTADNLLRDHPELLSDAQWTQFAHRLSVYHTGSDLLGFQGEQLVTHDFLQRVFTDNGHGDGRLTFIGMTNFAHILNYNKLSSAPDLAVVFLGPVVMATGFSRAEQTQIADEILTTLDDNLHRPLRDSEKSTLAIDDRVLAWHMSMLARVRHFPIAEFVPALSRAAMIAERCLGQVDGLTTAIAVEIYHRHHGRYPDSLAELAPQLLPVVPPDRITGEALHYRLIDGKPVIYSVGADRHDDGGRILDSKDNGFDTAWWGKTPGEAMKGDWVLFPQPHNTNDD